MKMALGGFLYEISFLEGVVVLPLDRWFLLRTSGLWTILY